MNAVISGRAAVAMVMDGEQLFSIHYDAPDERVERAVEDWNMLLGGVNDLEYFDAFDEAEARERLEDAVDRTEALDLVLYLFDGSLLDETRRSASLELEELLAYPEIADYLESILCARPLDHAADLEGARRCCDDAASSTRQLVGTLIDRQKAITVVRSAFDSTCEEIADREIRRDVESACLLAGTFARFANADNDATRITSVWMASLTDPNLTERLSADVLRGTLTTWTKAIRDVWRTQEPQPAQKPVSRIAEYIEHDKAGTQRKQKQRRSFDAKKAKLNTDLQKERAVELLKRRKFAQARRVIDQTVASNLKFGGAEYACKTLCSLAKSAQEFGLYDLQLELTERSIKLDPDDGWSWSQYGKALLDMGRPTDALCAYDEALVLTSDVEVKTGRAEVLRAQGKLPEALAAFDQVTKEHPQDVFAKNGRAEVLKAQGKLPEALAAFDQVTKEHPQDVFAKNGRAEVLKAQGKLPEALAAFDQVTKEHPENVVAKTGRAGVLKAQGKLPKALAAFDQVIEEHPEDVVAKSGRACVLALLERWDDALFGLPTGPQDFQGDWIGLHIRGIILLKVGDLAGAREIFEFGVSECQVASNVDFYRAGLCLVEMAERRFAAAAEQLASVRDPGLHRPKTLLHVHALGADGQYDNAAQIYRSAIAPISTLEREISEELDVRYITRAGQRHTDEWLLDRELRLILAA